MSEPLPALKQRLHAGLTAVAEGADPGEIYHPNARLWATYPFNQTKGLAAIGNFWAQLRRALPDLQRRDQIFIVGNSKADPRMPADLEGRMLGASMGHYQGSFLQDLCGIPATHGVVNLRVCEVHHLVDDKIAHSYIMLDLLDLMWQAHCWPIAPSLGAEGMWSGPATNDGVRLHSSDVSGGEAAFNTVIAMHNALGSFDGKSLDSMQHGVYWAENFLWYGPSGIGQTRGMSGFRAHHQIPFLTGFPDRVGAGHYVRIAEGDYVVTGGWPSVTGTHLGEWLGLPATGKHIEMRVMDFYRLENGVIQENWVPIDMLWILKQMGLDVLARLRHRRGDPLSELPQGQTGHR